MKKRVPVSRLEYGYTLIEIIIGLCVLMITLSLAIPSFIHWRKKTSDDLLAKKILSQLLFARSYAIQNNVKVTVCPSFNMKECGGSWDNPIITLADHVVLQSLDHSGVAMTWRGNLARNDQLVFTALGSTDGQQGSFVLGKHIKITVNRSGRVKAEKR